MATPEGEITADHVVIATSFWARDLLAPLNLNLPVFALEHHEIVTDDVDAIKMRKAELPTVRDPSSSSNVRQEGNGFLIGVYEEQPKPWSVDGIPKDFGPELLQPDLDRLADKLSLVMERFPAIAEAGIKVINNGPLCYTPDGCPLLGPVEAIPGLWLATGFNIGIGTGGGSAEFLAEWMTSGTPAYDLPIVHPSRFSNNVEKNECLNAIVATYARCYVTPKV